MNRPTEEQAVGLDPIEDIIDDLEIMLTSFREMHDKAPFLFHDFEHDLRETLDKCYVHKFHYHGLRKEVKEAREMFNQIEQILNPLPY